MDEELVNLQLDRIDQERSKTNEQLKRHTLDAVIENKPVEKALYLLSKGDEVQKISVVQSLPNLIKQDSHAVLGKVLPKIQQELSHSSCEFQVTTSHVFQMLIQNNLSSAEGTLTTAFVQNIESKDPIVANAWLEALLEIITLMPLKAIQTEVLPMAIQKGQCSQPVMSRNAACKILGKIAMHPGMKPLEIKKDILPAVHSLCQDINYNIRATICEQIPYIVQGLGCNLSKAHLLPSLVELSQDDNQNVRSIAVASVINCLPLLEKETKTQTMIPLILQFGVQCMKPENISSSVALSKDYGVLLSSVIGCTTPNEIEILIGYYIQMATRGLDLRKYAYDGVDTSQEVVCRQYCAVNLPSVTAFVVNNVPNYTERIYEVFKTLSSDSCYMVRQTVAGVLHEVGKTLGKQNIFLKPDFIRLLRDDAEEVLANLVPHLTKVFDLFIQTGLLALDRVTPPSVEISRALLKCLVQLKKGYNWRLLACFLKQLEHLPKCFKADQIHNEFTPAVVQCAVKGGTRPVRAQASRTLLVFLRWNTRQVQRTWLREHLISELAGSTNCYTRHIFIILCKNAFEIFSYKYFKENFYYPLLALTEDQVSTVRYSVVSLFPALKKMIRLPTDRKLLQALEHAIINLEKNEKDRDVLTNLIKRSKEMMVAQVSNESDENEQKRLMEEEEMIYKGKLNFPRDKNNPSPLQKIGPLQKNASLERTRSFKSLNRSNSVTRTNSGKSISMTSQQSTRSTSVPRTARTSRTVNSQFSTPSREIMSDMMFLNQHFITDAGVPLPKINKSLETENEPNQSTDDIISLVPTEKTDEIFNLDTTISNLSITDDVKVNMRKMSSTKSTNVSNKKRYSSEIPKMISESRNFNSKKRYSSILSENEISKITSKESNSNLNKRRSLVVTSKEISKIPIILKSSDVSDDKRGKDDSLSEEKICAKKGSSLPVPVRRKQL